MKQVVDLFSPEPQVWGLRGDPWVWQALRDRLSGTYLPPTLGEVEAILYTAVNRIVGVGLGTESSRRCSAPSSPTAASRAARSTSTPGAASCSGC